MAIKQAGQERGRRGWRAQLFRQTFLAWLLMQRLTAGQAAAPPWPNAVLPLPAALPTVALPAAASEPRVAGSPAPAGATPTGQPEALSPLSANWIPPPPDGVVTADGQALSSDPATVAFEQTLEERVRANPQDAAAWRLLGRARLQRQAWDAALSALQQAVALDSRSAAAHLDLGRVHQQLADTQAAADAYQRALTLAPRSDYARQAAERLRQLEAEQGIRPASYDIRTFDGSNVAPPPSRGAEPSFWRELDDALRVRLDLGVQYNDNVTLAPSSRELQSGAQAGAQANAALFAQWLLLQGDGWRAGPSFDSDFTLNEGGLDRFNLQSWRPGLFAEGDWLAGGWRLRPRFAYAFTHDEFHGRTFGNRHTLTGSLGSVWAPGSVSTLYYAADNNNVAQDGAVADITSQDGWSHTIGIVHDEVDRASDWRQSRLGIDYSTVQAAGRNFRFRAVSLYTQQVFVLLPQLHLTLKGGWSYRDYYDALVTPSRDTHVLRGSGEVRRYFANGVSAACFIGYDRFLSDNSRFDTDRLQSGGVLTWEF